MTLPEQIPQSDEMVVDEPNPYRRRQKVIRIRREGGIGKRLAGIILAAILLPLVLFYGGYRIARLAFSSPLFSLQPDEGVTLSGNKITSTQDVLNALDLRDSSRDRPASLFRIDLATIQRRIQSIPWIESATVTRVFPDSLHVTIVERRPVAYANVGGRVELVDKDGVLLPIPGSAALDFPVLYGLGSAAGMDQRKAMLAQYGQFMNDTRDEAQGSGWSVSEVDLSDPDDLRALLVEGSETVLAHFGDRDYSQRFQTFIKVTPQALASNTKVDSMDFRFRDEVVVDPVEQAAPPKPPASVARGPAATQSLARRSVVHKRRLRRIAHRSR